MKLALKKQKLKQLSNEKTLDNNATPNIGGAGSTYRCRPAESETGNRFYACMC
ncbi:MULTISPECIES: hypothetical protein [Pseudoalteromonas]|uniref:Uncharacterized protein n=1 Tax=Pseudoalteromonas luteoviolacea (strain 2ta16) TaxID=1353533 RepID=V4HRJ1_PSEL2|nr:MULTISPECIES: hypothetical protein [Pseudoalteromonas]ESP93430.1 hypothetical protein PL2TA16_03283 [Pseudoalteromonas luteoviolacea 2ta16]KZN43904.1 hypothetical protein N483_08265 [Pseudoalteromonas luteoviolacea NCIMB 1944]MCG7549157.1 hypothetical protein [Pseudoalteromonas sp. Of7M-16]